jgi:hypothetical protein
VRWGDVGGSFRRALRRLRQSISRKMRPSGPRIRWERVEEFPETLKAWTLYVAGDESHPWAAAILCPCGCGDLVQLNLLHRATPFWRIRHHRNGAVSVLPSICRTKGCRSHFFIRDSRIDWYNPPALNAARDSRSSGQSTRQAC